MRFYELALGTNVGLAEAQNWRGSRIVEHKVSQEKMDRGPAVLDLHPRTTNRDAEGQSGGSGRICRRRRGSHCSHGFYGPAT